MGGRGEATGNDENMHSQKNTSPLTLLHRVLNEHKFPVTVKIEKTEEFRKDNGMYTLQHRRVITQLEYTHASGHTTYIPVNNNEHALAVMIDNTETYRTIEELRTHKKEMKIRWFISTKEFHLDNVLCHVGNIFSFAPTSLLRSFRKGKKRGVYVLFYPTMEKRFVPMDTEGDFRKCECPSTCNTYKLSELAKMKTFPCLLSFEVNNRHIRDGIKTAEPYFAISISAIDIVYATKKAHGSLQLHTFSAHDSTPVHVQPDVKTIDTLNRSELETIIKAVVLPLNTDLRTFYDVHSYKELGISRLLDEIIDELAGRANNLSRFKFNSDRKPATRKRFTENLRKQLSFTENVKNQLFYSSGKHSSNISSKTSSKTSNTKNTPGITRHAYDTHKQRAWQPHHFYHNNDVISNTQTDIINGVDVDDSGYVIVPPVATTSKDCSDDGGVYLQPCTYKSSENMTYNYQFRMSEELDDHVYTYIHPVIISDGLDSSNVIMQCNDINHNFSSRNQHGVMNETNKNIYNNISRANGQHGADYINSDGARYKNVCVGQFGSDDDVNSLVYDYPHIGQLHLSKEQRKRQIKELDAAEVGDLLKVVKMKHHTECFRKNSIDGIKLASYCEQDLVNLHLTKFESVKLMSFVDGWRPLKASLGTDAWMTLVVCDWSVNDVCKYMSHLRMRALDKFCSYNDVDGYLLKKLVESDVIHSLKNQHDVIVKESDLEKLKAYVLLDEMPRFQFL